MCFLWHFPSSRPGWPLATSLPARARTFLSRSTRDRQRSSIHLLGRVYVAALSACQPRWEPVGEGLTDTHTGYMYQAMTPEAREGAHRRMRRIAGQVAGIERMIEEDRYCVDVLLQVAAVRAALDGVGKVLLRSHVDTCVSDALASGRARERNQKIAELMEVFSKFAHIGGR